VPSTLNFTILSSVLLPSKQLAPPSISFASPVSAANFTNTTFHGSYHTLADVDSFTFALVEAHSDRAHLISLGHSGEGREMYALRISSGLDAGGAKSTSSAELMPKVKTCSRKHRESKSTKQSEGIAAADGEGAAEMKSRKSKSSKKSKKSRKNTKPAPHAPGGGLVKPGIVIFGPQHSREVSSTFQEVKHVCVT
jgi:hypothetical protein